MCLGGVRRSHVTPSHDIAFINKFRAPTDKLPDGAKIDYLDYDWRLNSKSLPDR